MHTQTPPDTPISPPHEPKRFRPWPLLIGVVALVVAIIAGLAFAGDGDTEGETPAEPTDAALELSLGESDALASCLAFDVETLAAAPVAFQGTVTAANDTDITLTVDRWFTAGDASAVTLVGEHRSTALIAGFDPVIGDQYLISAVDGAVNYCGYSGPVSPELLASYEAAFPAA